VTSTPGKGAAFSFTLPAYEPVRTLHHAMDEMLTAAAAGKTEWALLVVDLQVAREAKDHRRPEELIAAFESEVRKSISRNDHVALAEAELLGVIASTDAKGAAALRQRLRDLCQRWWEPLVGRDRAACIPVGTAVYDGQANVEEIVGKARAAMTAPGIPTPDAKPIGDSKPAEPRGAHG
jgi:hypothetical protein